MNAQGNLFEVVRTLHPPSGFAGCLHRWQKQGD
jgi:hypothetical protein